MAGDDDWLRERLVNGLQWLYTLHLRGSPPPDVFGATCKAWIATVRAFPIAWEKERDYSRVSRAFLTLGGESPGWPAPSDFRKALPPVPQALALEHRPSPPSSDRRAALKDVLTRLSLHIRSEPAARPAPEKWDISDGGR